MRNERKKFAFLNNLLKLIQNKINLYKKRLSKIISITIFL